ncbi:hypothetical protein pb186bvf_011686 [Paramecium bursaria]
MNKGMKIKDLVFILLKYFFRKNMQMIGNDNATLLTNKLQKQMMMHEKIIETLQQNIKVKLELGLRDVNPADKKVTLKYKLYEQSLQKH